MNKIIKGFITLSILFAVMTGNQAIADQKIKFANVGWTGVTIKTKCTIQLLKAIGYDSEEKMMAVPITYLALSQGEVDVFVGNWMPSMESIAGKFFKKGTVLKYKANMPGAKYTLAAPAYVVDAGLKDFKDLVKYGDKLDWKIYGIEAGNDGNKIIQSMINSDLHGLGKFKLIPSSEATMLLQVGNYIKQNKWIVFLGWAPHSMNVRYDMKYLDGSTADTFGENNGTATVYTNLRKGFVSDHPNLAKFFNNLYFPINMMNESMLEMFKDKNTKHKAAGMQWIKAHPEVYSNWFEGVKTADGKPALPVIDAYLKSTQF